MLPSDSIIKAAPRRLTIFAGRLDKDVTADALSDYLKDAGIVNIVCKKLESKDGISFITAAFMISCDVKYANILYDDSIWPAGCELRDWVFHKKVGGDSNN